MKTVHQRLLFLGLALLASLPALFQRGWLSPLAADTPPPAPGTLVTVAGTGIPGHSNDDGPAQEAQLRTPLGLAVDAVGNLYIADLSDNRVRKVDAAGIITTFAGTGQAGFSGDNGPAREARLDGPNFLAFDGGGDLFITEASNRIRKVSPDGIITTVAGTGQAGYSGDGGPATQARLDTPHGLAVDREGNLYFPEEGGNRVRKVDTKGTISTVAGTGVKGFSGDGGPATLAKLNVPSGVAVDSAGNLYIADLGALPIFGGKWGSRVRKVSSDGTISTVAGAGPDGFSGDGGPAAEAQLRFPFAVAVDSAGDLFITDMGNHRVRKVDGQGKITTVAGIGPAPVPSTSGPANAATLRGPTGLTLDAAGNLYVATTVVPWSLFDGLKPYSRVVEVYGVAAPGLIAGQSFPQPKT